MLFYLYGPLVHPAPYLAEAVQRTLRDLGRPAVDPGRVEGWIGAGVARLVKRALTGELRGEPDPADFERAHARFLDHYEAVLSRESRPYPGVPETLAALRQRGVPLGCITNKPERFTRPLLRALGLETRFALVVSGDTLGRRKPDPQPLLHACSLLGVEPGRALYVGDSMTDARTARAAGSPFVAVRYGYHGDHAPEELGAARLLSSLTELLDPVEGPAGAPGGEG